jgi:hypothetical protein
MANCNMKCTIAGIRFNFVNMRADKFSANFLPFLYSDAAGGAEAASACCSVDVTGPDEGLRGLKSDKAWSFESRSGCAVLHGANAAGDVLWRMSGRFPFEELSFAWNPDTFFATYNSAYHGPYGIIVILALVLRLLDLKGIVLHCSASVVNGAGIICTGRSGRGKSTISALLRQEGVDVLTDERAVIRAETAGLRVYGTPWPSSGMCVLNSAAPLRKLYFLEHGAANTLEALAPGATLKRLLDVVMVPWMNSDFFDPLIDVLERVASGVPACVLSFVPDRAVVQFIREDLIREQCQCEE